MIKRNGKRQRERLADWRRERLLIYGFREQFIRVRERQREETDEEKERKISSLRIRHDDYLSQESR